MGAQATAEDPRIFRWLDGTLVNSNVWCSGHPTGGKNDLCAYYSTTITIGRDKCIKSSTCNAGSFKHNYICQSVYP